MNKTGYDDNYKNHIKNNKINTSKLEKIYFKKYIFNQITDQNGQILDIGCGTGDFMNISKELGYKNIEGIDLSKENVKYCLNLGLNCQNMGIDDFLNQNNKKYDYIMFNNVIEHIEKNEVKRILEELKNKLLNKNGTIFIISPNCNNINGLATFYSDITHIFSFTEKSFSQLLLGTNFNITYNNIYPISGFIIIDFFINSFWKIKILFGKINNLINGQKPFKVFSKNILIIMKNND